MAHAMDELLNSEALSENVKSSISEAWETQINEARENITAELREEFAQRYDADKAQIVEAMDSMISDVIAKELEEFQADHNKLAEDRVAYRKHMKQHANVLDSFVMDTLRKEIKDLREDRVVQEANMSKLEGFVLEQLTKELNEFHDDKRSLVEAKVRMIKEGKEVINQTKQRFINESATKVNAILEKTLKNELTTLKEDIQSAKENNFGRKIFETFAAEFMSSHLSEGTEVAKLNNIVNELNSQIDESKKTLAAKEVQLAESARNSRIVSDKANRKLVMSEMMAPLNKQQREIMNALLESTQTTKLQESFNKYLPSVFKDDAKVETKVKKVISESNTNEITGDKQPVAEATAGAEIINLRKLAGIS